MSASGIASHTEIVDDTIQQIKAHPEQFLGPWFLSLVVVTLMMGVIATQTTKYFSTFGYESPRLFWLVVSCVVLATAEWVALLNIEWNRCVTYYGDWSRFLYASRQTVALPITVWLTVFMSQLFFAWRCYTLYDRNKLIFGALLFGMTSSLLIFLSRAMLKLFPTKPGTRSILALSGLAVNVVTDIAITGLTLWKIGRGGASYSPHTQRALRRLRNLTIEGAVPPTFGVIVSISTCRVLPERIAVSLFLTVITPMLYVMSLLFTLNSRAENSRTFKAPSRKDHEQLSTGFKFAESHASDQTCEQVETGTTVVIPTTNPEPALLPHYRSESVGNNLAAGTPSLAVSPYGLKMMEGGR